MDERLSFITTNNLQYLLLNNKNVINSALCHLGHQQIDLTRHIKTVYNLYVFVQLIYEQMQVYERCVFTSRWIIQINLTVERVQIEPVICKVKRYKEYLKDLQYVRVVYYRYISALPIGSLILYTGVHLILMRIKEFPFPMDHIYLNVILPFFFRRF